MLSNKILLFIICILVLSGKNIYSNNIIVSGVALADQNTGSGFINVKFNISWDNSWRNTINYDAAWIFVKYNSGNGVWKHATLSNSNSNHFPQPGLSLNQSRTVRESLFTKVQTEQEAMTGQMQR